MMKHARHLAASLAVLVASLAAATPPKPTFRARRDYPVPLAQYSQVADVNGDGVPDIIVNGVYVLFGTGNGAFRLGPEIPPQPLEDETYVVAADLAGNGKVDLIQSGAEFSSGPWGIAVRLGNGDGTFQLATFYQAGTDIDLRGAVAGDFNGDGILDVAAVGNSGVWLFTGKGGGALNQGVLIPFSGSGAQAFNWMVAADFNHDGNLDLAVTTTTGFAVLLGNGNGTFLTAQNYTTPEPPTWIATADINVDGHPDIAVRRA